jgi:hypothetical protein
MKIDYLRKVVSSVLIFGHILAIAVVVWLSSREFISSEHVALFFAIAVPPFAAYSAAAIRYMVKGVNDDKIHPWGFFLAAFPCLNVVALGVIIWARASGFFTTCQGFAEALVGVEGCFGVYTGLVVSTIFPE